MFFFCVWLFSLKVARNKRFYELENLYREAYYLLSTLNFYLNMIFTPFSHREFFACRQRQDFLVLSMKNHFMNLWIQSRFGTSIDFFFVPIKATFSFCSFGDWKFSLEWIMDLISWKKFAFKIAERIQHMQKYFHMENEKWEKLVALRGNFLVLLFMRQIN